MSDHDTIIRTGMVRAQTITVGGAPHGNVLIRENTDTGRQRRRDKLLHKAASPGLKGDSDMWTLKDEVSNLKQMDGVVLLCADRRLDQQDQLFHVSYCDIGGKKNKMLDDPHWEVDDVDQQ